MARHRKEVPVQSANGPERLYQTLARQLFTELAKGHYAVGDRLPAERELSIQYNVSRLAVRETMIALEVQGMIEVRVGSGAYVRALPSEADAPGFTVTAFELMEAHADRGRGCSACGGAYPRWGARRARTAGGGNRERKPSARRQHHGRSGVPHDDRHCHVQPVVEEHLAVLDAPLARSPSAARTAMRGHMASVIDHLLFATEEEAVEAARRNVATSRERYARAASR